VTVAFFGRKPFVVKHLNCHQVRVTVGDSW